MSFDSVMGTLGQLGQGASALSAIGSLFGGDSNQAALEQQNYAQNFQKEMRATAWQTTVQDMNKAGINPMAAFGSGATATPSAPGGGQIIQKGLQRAQIAQATGSAAQALQQVQKTEAETELVEAQKRLTEAQIPYTTTSTQNLEQQTKNLQGTFEKMQYEMKNIITETALKENQNLTETQRRTLIRYQTSLADVEAQLKAKTIDLTEAQTRGQEIINQMKKLEIPGLENTAKWEQELGMASRGVGLVGEGARAVNAVKRFMGSK